MFIKREILLLLVIYISCTLVIEARIQKKEEGCSYDIVQSMPEGLDLVDPPAAKTIPTHVSLLQMTKEAKSTLRIASFYWWLTAPKEFADHPSAEPGLKIMEALKNAADRGVKVEIVLDHSGRREMSNSDDVKKLKEFAEVKFLNMTQLLKAGILHTKFMIADNKTFYIGSSNFDWRSYLQIKEIGLSMWNCPELAEDLDKIFRTYMLMADQSELPSQLTDDFKTSITQATPFELDDIKIFFASSPPAFNDPDGKHSTGRTDDIEALLNVIKRAKRRIDISVMNYSPQFEFGWPRHYWPVIDDALRRAAVERRVEVRLLFSNWTNSKPVEKIWYNSLNAIQSKFLKGGIHVKLLKVPAFDEFQKSIPYARVKHDKYMVTDDELYIGTSNWTPSYFTNTCGVGLVIQSNSAPSSWRPAPVVETMQKIFDRDFNSEYSHELDQLA